MVTSGPIYGITKNQTFPWKIQLEERRSEIYDNDYSERAYDAFNDQVEDYNKECATPDPVT